MRRFVPVIVLASILIALPPVHPSLGSVIVPLPSTGQGLSPGQVDLNYSIVASPYGGTETYAVSNSAASSLGWMAAPAGSQWISPSSSLAPLVTGGYQYRLIFSVPGIQSVSGYVAADSQWDIVYYPPGGTTVESGNSPNPSYGSSTFFTLSGGFTGQNDVLDFWVINQVPNNYGTPSPTGLLVYDLTATAVPLPAPVLLGAIGLACSAWRLRRKGA
jgi:hypothetical protein